MKILRGFFAFKSLVFGLIVLVLWVRSFFAADCLRSGNDLQYVRVTSTSGVVVICFRHDGQKTRLAQAWDYDNTGGPRDAIEEAGLSDSPWNRIGFGCSRRLVSSPGGGMIVNLMLPHWMVFLLAIPSAVKWTVRRARKGIIPEEPAICCPRCGQLLPSIPDFCPLCGQALATPPF